MFRHHVSQECDVAISADLLEVLALVVNYHDTCFPMPAVAASGHLGSRLQGQVTNPSTRPRHRPLRHWCPVYAPGVIAGFSGSKLLGSVREGGVVPLMWLLHLWDQMLSPTLFPSWPLCLIGAARFLPSRFTHVPDVPGPNPLRGSDDADGPSSVSICAGIVSLLDRAAEPIFPEDAQALCRGHMPFCHHRLHCKWVLCERYPARKVTPAFPGPGTA
ncbi:uncharacterized protein B0I36DRAFT_130082 [Microdochium trichocladiopsis]|uniref:Uncharacterized protein n=1 Tax=Microdochium trichocladiopsis TaxID=1682393 RepID=A0A9P9BSX7_9PEZI|nr:uncharacterized protein B0I36DRAFT_130082 [Microdochium trichocladiopsis]KAH7029276.1 hypothetical protein B0I36DRAFT_130082 [Microdochium trichocladiopsis]